MKYQIKKFIKTLVPLALVLTIISFSELIPSLLMNTFNIKVNIIIPIIIDSILIILAAFSIDFIGLFKWKKIEENGIKVEGHIIGAYDERRYSSSDNSYISKPQIMIDFLNPKNNKHDTFITEMSPLSLSSKECTIYLYGQRIYATNFKHKKLTDKTSIWTDKEIHNYIKFGHMDNNNYDDYPSV